MSMLGQRSIFVHQFAVQAEKTITAVCQTAVQFGDTRALLFKAMDQEQWMAAYDIDPQTGRPFPAAIDSLSTWIAAREEAANAGVDLIPWVVPGHSSQAPLHAQLGPRLVVDAEPYRGFWADTPGDFVVYINGLLAAGVTELYISTDPRRSLENALDENQWAGQVTGLLPQIYWTDFQQPYQVVLPMLQTLVQLNSNVIPVLPHDGSGDFPQFWQAAQKIGIAGACLWVFGAATGAELQAFAQLDPGKPTDPCAELQAQIATLQSTLDQTTADRDTAQQKLTDMAAIIAR